MTHARSSGMYREGIVVPSNADVSKTGRSQSKYLWGNAVNMLDTPGTAGRVYGGVNRCRVDFAVERIVRAYPMLVRSCELLSWLITNPTISRLGLVLHGPARSNRAPI